MRATGQIRRLEGPLEEGERRLVAARAILGEWLAGSGGGWQDSGGVWPGIKLIEGQEAGPDDPECGLSRGRLLPAHHILTDAEALARDAAEAAGQPRAGAWRHGAECRADLGDGDGEVSAALPRRMGRPAGCRRRFWRASCGDLKPGDIAALGEATTRNFFGPLQTIIPWASNLYTETLIAQVQAEFGADFWGFWMLGGMSGGGMGFIFDPEQQGRGAGAACRRSCPRRARHLEHALPFAMEPVVYDFAINDDGTTRAPAARRRRAPAARLLRPDPAPADAAGPAHPAARAPGRDGCRSARPAGPGPNWPAMVPTLFDRLLPRTGEGKGAGQDLNALLAELGFDPVQHEQIRGDLQHGRIGLAQNRLPASSDIRDVEPGDVLDGGAGLTDAMRRGGRGRPGERRSRRRHPRRRRRQPLDSGRGRGQGPAPVRQTRRAAPDVSGSPPRQEPPARAGGGRADPAHLHDQLPDPRAHRDVPALRSRLRLPRPAACCRRAGPSACGSSRPCATCASPGRRCRSRRWTPSSRRSARAGRAALIGWAQAAGEASRLPGQPARPVPAPGRPLVRGPEPAPQRHAGVAACRDRPQLKYLLVHNIDTLGADVDPALLGLFQSQDAALMVEVMPRRLEDRGGGLARVDGRLRLVEGLAMPREEDEFGLTYYNSLTTWVDIDRLLDGLRPDPRRPCTTRPP